MMRELLLNPIGNVGAWLYTDAVQENLKSALRQRVEQSIGMDLTITLTVANEDSVVFGHNP
jgi:hypothetical protein